VDEIVVGVDRSDASASALRWAADEARRAPADLVVVHAYLDPVARVQQPKPESTDADPTLQEAARQRLAPFVDDAGADLEGVQVTYRLHAGRAAAGLLIEARAARLLVVGSRGAGGFEGLLLGSTAEHCARHAVCPVVVVPARTRPRTGHLSVGVDGSPAAERALAWAVREAGLRGASLEVIGVYQPYDAKGPYGGEFMRIADPGSTERFRREAEERVSKAIASVETRTSAPITSVVLAGHPANVLVQRAAGSDLLVVGRRGRHGFPGLLLGSVARQVLHHASCPIAVVPS
jgi:nucleotide-binding universal stress UspA family protein